MREPLKLAIIGSGPSALYLLQHLVANGSTLSTTYSSITIFEKSAVVGAGTPFNPETTDIYHQANISSEELPELPESLADWLKGLSDSELNDLGIEREKISTSAIYSRLTIGRFFQVQFSRLVEASRQCGWKTEVHSQTKIVDIGVNSESNEVWLRDDSDRCHTFDRVVNASGHSWPENDVPEAGYFGSPWPIQKLIPKEGDYYNFEVGLLGASLSAFDVVATLAHRHGRFFHSNNGEYSYLLNPEARGFQLVLHSKRGWLPHLQYEQEEPIREIYRHASLEKIVESIDEKGFLRLETYFDKICRTPLLQAAEKDEYAELVELLRDPHSRWGNFIELLSQAHDSANAFDGLREELPEAVESVKGDKPVHWKETFDDLIYMLNYHAELLAAEDHIRLKSELMPFLLSVVAAMPLQSARLLLALKAAGVIQMEEGKVSVASKDRDAGFTVVHVKDGEKTKTTTFRVFVDCRGQSPVEFEDYPYDSLKKQGYAVPARARFAGSPEGVEKSEVFCARNVYYYRSGGVWIDSAHRLCNEKGEADQRLHEISYPNIMGVRPYSYGLQACDKTARIVVESWLYKQDQQKSVFVELRVPQTKK